MAEFDVDAMIQRFAERAQAVKDRPLPPVAGSERQLFIRQAQTDYTDFALVANASWSVEDGHLVLRIPRPQLGLILRVMAGTRLFRLRKGGTGKSAVSAALALRAQRQGDRVLAMEIGEEGSLASHFATTPLRIRAQGGQARPPRDEGLLA